MEENWPGWLIWHQAERHTSYVKSKWGTTDPFRENQSLAILFVISRPFPFLPSYFPSLRFDTLCWDDLSPLLLDVDIVRARWPSLDLNQEAGLKWIRKLLVDALSRTHDSWIGVPLCIFSSVCLFCFLFPVSVFLSITHTLSHLHSSLGWPLSSISVHLVPFALHFCPDSLVLLLLLSPSLPSELYEVFARLILIHIFSTVLFVHALLEWPIRFLWANNKS